MKALRWREHPAARAELLDAARWYESEQTGLGPRLADAITDGLSYIRSWPEAAPSYRASRGIPSIRRKAVAVFPYAIIYVVLGEEVVVVAYAHERRRPGYWRERLGKL